MDIKIQFDQFDMLPGPAGKRFQRNLLLHGGKTDSQGYSISDCFLRMDAYAVAYGQPIIVPAPLGTVLAPGAPLGPAGVGAVAGRQARKARLKESFSFLIMHLSDPSTLDLIGDPLSPFFQNGPDTYDWIMQQVIKPPTTGDLQDMTIAFWQIEIISDVGISVNTITDSVKLLRVVNADFPIARRFNDDQISEKLLSMIEHGSKMFALEAKKELDSIEGAPGTPGVRQFQLAVPAAGGPRPRDLNGIIVFWQGQWEAAVKSNALPTAGATGQAGKARRRHTLSAHVAREQAFSVDTEERGAPVAPPPLVRGGSPSRTLVELTDAGFSLTRGTVTTSDWRLAGHAELARSSVEGDGGDEFSVEFCFDADDQMSIELLCHNCGGAGHPARLCPSPKKLRTSQFMIALHTSAAKRKEENGLTKYGAAVGGRRPPPRGQRTPFKPMPKRFSASTPFRKFLPANAPGAGAPGVRPEQRARAAVQAARALADLANVALAEAEQDAARAEDGEDEQDDLAGQLSELVLAAPEAPAPTAAPVLAATPTGLEIPGRVMPSVFSSEGFYANVVNEVVLPAQPVMGQPVPPTLDVLPTDLLARIVGLAANTELFVLCGVSRGFELAVHVHVDGVYAAEDRARKGSLSPTGWGPYSESSATDTDMDDDMAAPRPRSYGYLRFLCAVTVVSLLTWLISCALAVRSTIARVLEAATDASVVLPAGLSTILIIFLFASRAQAYPTRGAGAPAHAVELARGAIVLPYDVTAAAPAGHVFDLVESCKAAMATLATSQPNAPSTIRFCWDSGCTCYCIPTEDMWMLDSVTDPQPNIGVEVASSTILTVQTIGTINSTFPPKLVCDSFRVDALGARVPTVSAPCMSRVLVTKGIKASTRLAGVGPSRRLDKTLSYFNDDNSARIEDCLRFADGAYILFDGSRHEIVLRIPTANDLATLARDCAHVGYTTTLSPVDVHASLGHCSDRRLRSAQIVIRGIDLRSFVFDAADCRGCREGKTREPSRKSSSAPSRLTSTSGTRREGGVEPRREPSTTGYEFFGQRVDTDICTSMPTSWPHGFTAMMNMCDRHTAEFLLSFLVDRSSAELCSALEDFERRIKHRLRDGHIARWHTDNETGFDGPEVKAVAAELILLHTKSPPNAKNKNPVAERNFGTLEPGIRATLCYAHAPECLWPWAAAHIERVLYFLPSRAHEPAKSAYHFTHPDAGDADLAWVKPLFCDVTVHLAARDMKTKTGPTGADGCFLGHDFIRGCEFVYVPSLRRLSSYVVTTWRTNSFEICKQITADTPVEYHQMDDLRYGPATAALLPKVIRAARKPAVVAMTAEKEGAQDGPTGDAVSAAGDVLRAALARRLATNAQHVADGVKALEKEGVASFSAEVLAEVRADEGRALATAAALAAASADDVTFEVRIHGNAVAHKVAEQYGIPKIHTVQQAMASPYWPLIREGMEAEILGKLANKAFSVVPRRPGMRVMKSKWCIDFKFEKDGSIKSIKCRFVGCGYSQIEGADFDKTYAATLSGCCLRLWCSIVADEDLETDSIDAVKAFTQSDVDRELHVNMPIGFAVPGHVLLLHKALEGIKQGSYLWFQKNKHAWNKCGMHADPVEPNLYINEALGIIAAVFADDVGAGFPKARQKDYLKIRLEYSKLINIDSVGPETIRPVTKFTGVDIARDRDAGTLTISMGTYIRKLMDRNKGVPTHDMPTPKSKAQRTAFENLVRGSEETTVDRTGYLTRLGEVSWPANMCWPELSFYTSSLGQFSQSPTQAHHDALAYAMGYLFSDPDKGITFGGELKVPFGLETFPANFSESRGLYVATDSSWGTKARPHGGHVVMRCNGAVLWSAKTLKVVTDSTAHAETAEASRATKSVIFVRMVLVGISRGAVGPTAVLGDNSAMVELVTKEGASSRTRHFERATVLIKYAVLQLIVTVHLISTKFMCADVFTKATDEQTFKTMRSVLRNEPSPDGYAIRAVRWINTLMRVSSPM